MSPLVMLRGRTPDERALMQVEGAYLMRLPYILTGVLRLCNISRFSSATKTSIGRFWPPSLNSGLGDMHLVRKFLAGISPSGDFSMHMVPPVMIMSTLASGRCRWESSPSATALGYQPKVCQVGVRLRQKKFCVNIRELVLQEYA